MDERNNNFKWNFEFSPGSAEVSVKSTTRGRVSTWRVRIALRILLQLSNEAFTRFSTFRSYFYLQNTPARFVQRTAGHFVRVDSTSAYVRDSQLRSTRYF